MQAITDLTSRVIQSIKPGGNQGNKPLCTLDHIVLLLDKQTYDNLPTWLSDNFTIIPGGQHSNQPSQNKLIIFEDGTYIELFNWYDTPPASSDAKPMSSWSDKRPGLIDFALSSLPPSTADSWVGEVNSRLAAGDAGLGVAYKDPMPGGRKTNEGVDIKWKVTRARYSHGPSTPADKYFPGGRLDVPFFCHDVTERELRVPFQDPDKTKHACGAVGIVSVEVVVPAERLAAYAEVYGKVLGVDAEALSEGAEKANFVIRAPGSESGTCTISLRAAKGEDDVKWMEERGIGIHSLTIGVSGNAGKKEPEPLGSDKIGSTVRIVRMGA